MSFLARARSLFDKPETAEEHLVRLATDALGELGPALSDADWTRNLDLVDAVNRGGVAVGEAVLKTLRRRLTHRSHDVQVGEGEAGGGGGSTSSHHPS